MDESFASVLTHVARLLRRSFDARARALGVTRPQWQVLGNISRHQGLNQGALADLLEVEAITVGRMIDRMEDARLVERRADPADRRAWKLFTTAKGDQFLADLWPSAQETIEAALSGLDDAQRADLMAMLGKVRSNLSRFGEESTADG